MQFIEIARVPRNVRSGARQRIARRRLAAADAKVFDEALFHRDESLANVKRWHDGAMAFARRPSASSYLTRIFARLRPISWTGVVTLSK